MLLGKLEGLLVILVIVLVLSAGRTSVREVRKGIGDGANGGVKKNRKTA